MNFILTVLTDIVTSLQVTRWLEVMSLIVVIMLLSSPGAIGTIIGLGAKIGLVSHMRETKNEEGTAEA